MDILDVILLLGSAQGVLLAALVFQRYRRPFANRFLGWLMLAHAMTLLSLMLSEIGFDAEYPHLLRTLAAVPFLIAPLHFLYARYLVGYSTQFNIRDTLHFVPFIIYQLYILHNLFIPAQELSAAIQAEELHGLSPVNRIFNAVIIMQGFTYMFLTLYTLRRYARYSKDVFSTLDRVRLTWLRNITLMVLTVLVIFLTENLFLAAGINLSNYFNISSVLFAMCVYVMGYIGLAKSEIFTTDQPDGSATEPPETSGTREKYERSGLSRDRLRIYRERVLKLMNEEQPYLENGLTLHNLAERMSISPHNLSEVINSQFHKNFFDFVNHYRVEQVKRDMMDESKQHLTLLALALDAGFNSKSSFNLIFKKQTGSTPSAYRDELRK